MPGKSASRRRPGLVNADLVNGYDHPLETARNRFFFTYPIYAGLYALSTMSPLIELFFQRESSDSLFNEYTPSRPEINLGIFSFFDWKWCLNRW